MNLYIVTGTTQGLGKALAEAIARDPANELVALARAPDAPIPGGARIEVDLADGAAIERACDRVEQRMRGKRYEKAVLINNAGVVAPVAALEAIDADALERNLLVNLVAPMRLMRRFLRMTEGAAPLRRVINISSGAGRRPIFGWSAYCAAKAGLDMATRVVPDANVASEGAATAARIAEGAPLVARWHKKFVRRLRDPAPISQAEADECFDCFDTADFRAGYAAFLAKEKPRFEGR